MRKNWDKIWELAERMSDHRLETAKTCGDKEMAIEIAIKGLGEGWLKRAAYEALKEGGGKVREAIKIILHGSETEDAREAGIINEWKNEVREAVANEKNKK